jgi:beta-glucosidase-like glycosyl hydrolase
VFRKARRRYQMKKPRLGIPRLITVEAFPGFMSNGATSFPQELGLASPRGVISPDKNELSMYCACARTTRAEKTKTIAKSLSLFML